MYEDKDLCRLVMIGKCSARGGCLQAAVMLL